MGSLSSQLPPTPPPSPVNSVSGYRVFASFCPKVPSPNLNMSNWIECYNPSNNTWHRVGSIPGPIENQVLKGFAMVGVRDSIYVIGGRLCHKEEGHGSNDVIEVDLEVLPTVLRYDVHSDAWSKCAPLGIPRFNFACTVCDDKIYVAGGQCTLSSGRGISSAEVYDPALDTWTRLPDMSTMRYKCVGLTWQGKIHVVGGFAERGDSSQALTFSPERSSAEVFDPCHSVWQVAVRMWRLDVPPNQIVDVGGRLFSSGDCLNAWKGHIEAYDEKDNMWNIVNGSHLHTISSPVSTSDSAEENWPPIQRLYLTMAPIGTCLYFLAGYRMPGELPRSMSVVHIFETSAAGGDWRSFEPMEEEGDKELCSHCCVLQVS